MCLLASFLVDTLSVCQATRCVCAVLYPYSFTAIGDQMPNHLLLTATGGYNANLTALQNESWTCTTRLALVNGSVDPIAALPDLNVNAADNTVINTGYVVSSNYDIGGTGGSFDPVSFLENEAVTAWTGLLAGIPVSDQTELWALTCYVIDGTGKVAPVSGLTGSKAKAQLAFADGYQLKGVGTQDMTSADVSMCLSWSTQRADGHGRGRMYLPGLSRDVMGTASEEGTFNSSVVSASAPIASTFISDLAGSSGLGAFNWRPAVIGKPWTDYAYITAARVGRNPDVQRRRTRQVTEEYVSSSVVY